MRGLRNVTVIHESTCKFKARGMKCGIDEKSVMLCRGKDSLAEEGTDGIRVNR